MSSIIATPPADSPDAAKANVRSAVVAGLAPSDLYLRRRIWQARPRRARLRVNAAPTPPERGGNRPPTLTTSSAAPFPTGAGRLPRAARTARCQKDGVLPEIGQPRCSGDSEVPGEPGDASEAEQVAAARPRASEHCDRPEHASSNPHTAVGAVRLLCRRCDERQRHRRRRRRASHRSGLVATAEGYFPMAPPKFQVAAQGVSVKRAVPRTRGAGRTCRAGRPTRCAPPRGTARGRDLRRLDAGEEPQCSGAPPQPTAHHEHEPVRTRRRHRSAPGDVAVEDRTEDGEVDVVESQFPSRGSAPAELTGQIERPLKLPS